MEPLPKPSVCLCVFPENVLSFLGPFPSDTPLAKTTTSALTFCSIECLEVSQCKGFAYLTTVNTENCHLLSTANGIATSSPAEVYKKRNYEKTIRVSIKLSPMKREMCVLLMEMEN